MSDAEVGSGGCGGGGGACCGGGEGSCAEPAGEVKPKEGSWVDIRSRSRPDDPKKCLRCKVEDARVMARQREPTCWGCLYTQVVAKVQPTARGKGLVVEGDHIVAAISGGVGSTAMLHLLGDMRSSVANRKERGKVRFQMEAVHIDEGCAYGMGCGMSAAHVSEIMSAAKVAAQGQCDVHVVPLENIFLSAETQEAEGESGRAARRHKLADLLSAVRDATGREDLIAHLRMELLRATTQRLGAKKLAIGSSATRCAITTIEMTCKGKGFALPGSIQYRDAREGVGQPMLCLPMRDVGSKELALVCRHQKLPLCPLPMLPSVASFTRSINILAAHFVASLQERLPSSVPTILGTSSKLAPFAFNGVPERVKGKLQPPTAGSDPLCPLCRAPFTARELARLADATAGDSGRPACCLSCDASILKGGTEGAAVEALLPQIFAERSISAPSSAQELAAAGGGREGLRQRISDFLLEDD